MELDHLRWRYTDICEAYRKLALIPPDVVAGSQQEIEAATARFRDIQEAEVLSDRDKRRVYDSSDDTAALSQRQSCQKTQIFLKFSETCFCTIHAGRLFKALLCLEMQKRQWRT